VREDALPTGSGEDLVLDEPVEEPVLDQLPEDPPEVVPEEAVDAEEPCDAARPVNAAVAIAARRAAARVMCLTRRRLRSRWILASMLMTGQ